MKLRTRKDCRKKRHERIRKKVSGSNECPRMAVTMSSKYIYVQFVDDVNGLTMASVSTMKDGGKKNIVSAGELGKKAAEIVLSKGIKSVVVDRGGFKFHGRVKAIVDAVVEGGVQVGSTVVSKPSKDVESAKVDKVNNSDESDNTEHSDNKETK